MIHVVRDLGCVPLWCKGGVVAIGNFDGLHYGHRVVLGVGRGIAETLGVPFGVVTFEPHPRSVLGCSGGYFRLSTLRVKLEVLEGCGVSFVLLLRFDRRLRTTGAEDFVREVLLSGVGVRHVVVGYNFRFGYGREGDVDVLRRCVGGVTGVGDVRDVGGMLYSSSRVREALRLGDLLGVRDLLGRYWCVVGRVRVGAGRGRMLGFPTANVDLGLHVRPVFGVYVVYVEVRCGGVVEGYRGIGNIGFRPTFGGSEERLEVHLFECDRDLYGQVLWVYLVEYLRGERRFDGVDALRRQISKDIECARGIFERTAGL